MSKHTPGPWEFAEADGEMEIRMGSALGPSGACLAQHAIVWSHALYPDDGAQYEEAMANARLIAAAPDLYEVVCDLVSDCKGKVSPGLYTLAEKALAKARGETR